jgi:hypothetical protein
MLGGEQLPSQSTDVVVYPLISACPMAPTGDPAEPDPGEVGPTSPTPPLPAFSLRRRLGRVEVGRRTGVQTVLRLQNQICYKDKHNLCYCGNDEAGFDFSLLPPSARSIAPCSVRTKRPTTI